MTPRLPERNKRPGIHYAVTNDGVELPVVDVSHPAFALVISETEQQQLVERFLRDGGPFEALPNFLRNLFLRYFLRGSTLANSIRQARTTFMTGMHRYVLKLGPEMLGSAYSKPIDRRIAASLPVLNIRLRLQDVVRLMADVVPPALLVRPSGPVYLVNIGGGPALDSLNTLILLRQEHPDALAERRVVIDVLDPDTAGPAFGETALAALSETGAPLAGLQVAFRHIRYDWAQTGPLASTLRAAEHEQAVILCSTEGALFEYGSDAEIEANLRTLRAGTGVLAVVGSVTRSDEPTQKLRKTGVRATHPRGLAAFQRLVERAGWRMTRAIERPFLDQVLLT